MPAAANLRTPKPLPKAWINPAPVFGVGIIGWLLGLVAFGVARLCFSVDNMLGIWTCVAGMIVGAIGYGLFRWQRSAARRGSQGAQDGLV